MNLGTTLAVYASICKVTGRNLSGQDQKLNGIAEWFDIEYEGYPGSIRPLEEEMKNDKHVWEKISEDYGRAIDNLDELASP